MGQTSKKWSASVAVSLGALLTVAGLAPAAQAADITVPDAVLRACILDKLGKPASDPITDAEALSVTALTCDAAGSSQQPAISSLEGLDSFTNLNVLALNHHSVTDLAPLAGLTQLEQLYLIGNAVEDLAPLSGLVGLKTLQLDNTGGGNNHVSDLSPLSGLPNLHYLDVSDNQVSDISPVAQLAALGTLNLNRNVISDVTALADNTNIAFLGLDGNQITDPSAIGSMTGLAGLAISDNRISDISPLAAIASIDFGVKATGQRVILPATVPGAVQDVPFIDFMGNRLALEATQTGVAIAPNGTSWSFDAAGTQQQVVTVVQATPVALGVTEFSGIVVQDVMAPRATPLLDDIAETPRGVQVTIDVLANDGTDPALDFDTLRLLDGTAGVSSLTVAGGTFTVVNGSIVFVPEAGFVGDVTVRYTVVNIEGVSSEAGITVTVTEPPSGSDSGTGAGGDSDGSNGTPGEVAGSANASSNTGGAGTSAASAATASDSVDPKGLAVTGGNSSSQVLGLVAVVALGAALLILRKRGSEVSDAL